MYGLLSAEELEERYYEKVFLLKEYGLSGLEIGEIVNECSMKELDYIIEQLEKERR